MNGSMPMRDRGRVRPAAARASGCSSTPTTPSLAGHDLGAPILGDAAETGTGDPAAAPPHYRHHPDDPVAITHSSGTTRMPAAVVHSHHSLFAAVRAVRLTEPRAARSGAGDVGASRRRTRPASSSSTRRSATGTSCCACRSRAARSPTAARSILDAIERWRPTAVFGFAVTWAELARFDLTTRDVSSVRIWSNTGDCAHEAHIRRLVAVGSHHAYSRTAWSTRPGSRFNDTLGSTEMGYGGFRITHRPGTERYDRCVGKPFPFAEIILVDAETGEEVPVGEVGQVAMKSPTLALGYWNDSVNTFRTRLNGYYLTGDLMYRDEEGYFYHVDRASDAIDLGDGNWLYTALSEERILAALPGRSRLHGARGPRRRRRAGHRGAADARAPDADPARDRERRGPGRAGPGGGGGAAARRHDPR